MSLETFEITFTPGSSSDVQGALSVPFYVRWGRKQGVGEFRLPLSLERLDALIEFLQVCQDLRWAQEMAERPDVADAIRVLMLGPKANVSTNMDSSATQLLILPSAADCIRRIGGLLFINLCPPHSPVRRLWDTFYSSAIKAPDVEHRIVLQFLATLENSTLLRLLVALPWEAICDAENQDPFIVQVSPANSLTMVRHYQPANVSSAPITQLVAPAELPTLLLLESQDPYLADLIEQTKPIDHDNDFMVWYRAIRLNWPPDQVAVNRLAGTVPHLVNFVGHGTLQGGETLLMFGPNLTEGDRKEELLLPVGPYSLARWLVSAFERPPLLFSVFACLSGTPGGQLASTGGPMYSLRQLSPGRSFIDTLAPSIPALLVMQALLTADDAQVASQTFYSAIAEEKSVVLAVRAMRLELYERFVQFREKRGGIDTGWWVPTLYLNEPLGTVKLVDRKQYRANRLLPDLETHLYDLSLPDTILRAISGDSLGRFVVLRGRPSAGKTLRLCQIAYYLRGNRKQVVAPRLHLHNRNAWIRIIKTELGMMLRIVSDREADYDSAAVAYETLVCSSNTSDRPIVLLVDDGNLLTNDEWHSLLPNGLSANLTVVATAPEGWIPPQLPLETLSIDLEPLSDDVLRKIQRPKYDLYCEQRGTLHIQYPRLPFERLETVFLIADVPLSERTLAAIAESSVLESEAFLDYTAKHNLAVRLGDGRYALSRAFEATIQELRRPLREIDFQHWVNTFIRSQYITDYPDDLLELLAHPRHRKQIYPFHYEFRDGPPLFRWLELAQCYILADRHGAFVELAIYHARQRESLELMTDVLYFLIISLTQIIPPELGDAYLWYILRLRQNDRLEMVELPTVHQSPSLIGLSIALTEPMSPVLSPIVEAFSALEQSERKLGCTMVAGAYRGKIDILASLAEHLSLTASERLHFGTIIARMATVDGVTDLPPQLFAWLDQDRNAATEEGACLFAVLYPYLDRILAKSYAQRLASWSPELGMSDNGLPTCDILVASAVIDRLTDRNVDDLDVPVRTRLARRFLASALRAEDAMAKRWEDFAATLNEQMGTLRFNVVAALIELRIIFGQQAGLPQWLIDDIQTELKRDIPNGSLDLVALAVLAPFLVDDKAVEFLFRVELTPNIRLGKHLNLVTYLVAMGNDSLLRIVYRAHCGALVDHITNEYQKHFNVSHLEQELRKHKDAKYHQADVALITANQDSLHGWQNSVREQFNAILSYHLMNQNEVRGWM